MCSVKSGFSRIHPARQIDGLLSESMCHVKQRESVFAGNERIVAYGKELHEEGTDV